MHVLALVALAQISSAAGTPPEIPRDSFGVPIVRAATRDEAMRLMGRAVAEDRLWQLELSRRVATGRMAEMRGAPGLASDRATLALAYTDAELLRMFGRLPSSAQSAFRAYVQGINDAREQIVRENRLPPPFKDAGITPEPWKLTDTLAICVRMARLFGSGGAGELRNLGILQYLRGQRAIQGRAFEVLDDFSWQNDESSPVTLHPRDDAWRGRTPQFPNPTRAQTSTHFESLPPSSLLEILPTISLSSQEPVRLLAEKEGTLHKTGSYAVVASGRRSASGGPVLLSGPQMGHFAPSVVHEIEIDVPGYRVAGMNVPGIPGILVGRTPRFAWALTSGVADVVDIFVYPKLGEDRIKTRQGEQKLSRVNFTIPVRGSAPVTVSQARIPSGPVILDSRVGNAVYVQRAAYHGAELEGFADMLNVPEAKNPTSLDGLLKEIPLTFNFFYAFQEGTIGWRYCGRVPRRELNLDPRLPIPGHLQTGWTGFLSPGEMPSVQNPQSGVLTNWNNKPATWWPNFDTPVWGATFRQTLLDDALGRSALSGPSVMNALEQIAKMDDRTNGIFIPLLLRAAGRSGVQGLSTLLRSDEPFMRGQMLAGRAAPRLHQEFVRGLREEIFVPHVGTFVAPGALDTVAQADVIRRALARQTHFDYLAGRTPDQIADAALKRALNRLGGDTSTWRFSVGAISIPGVDPIPYNNRGTYLQWVDFGTRRAASVLAPGNAEFGAHSRDQVEFARHWRLKPARWSRDFSEAPK